MLATRLEQHTVADGGSTIPSMARVPVPDTRRPCGRAYSQTRRFVATPDISTAFKNQPQRYVLAASLPGDWII